VTEKRRLRVVPILITLAATLILAVGSFYGCSRTYMVGGGQAKLNSFFFCSFLVCAVACVVSLIWLLVTIVINFFRRGNEGP
jgi:cation transporter-like permease